jgi:hypothetical protein
MRGGASLIVRTFLTFWIAVALLPAQVANNANVNSSPGLFDSRPFGKYLVQICTLSDGLPPTLSCPPESGSINPPEEKTPQTITIKQVGCARGTTPCPAPVYPVTVGSNFIVTATADSGLQVTQTVVSGNVTPLDGHDTQQYTVTGLGTIVIKATVDAASDKYAAAAPVELILTVTRPGDKSASGCGLFEPSAPGQSQRQIDVPGIIGLIGNPTPFVLAAQGKNIFIYSTRFPLRDDEKKILATIPPHIAALAGRSAASLGVTPTAKPFSVELSIPHASALGDLATSIAGLNYSQFTVQDIGTDRVRVNATSQPDCETWTAFLEAIRHLEWRATP